MIPDCAGTEFETTYRTWFHFGVRGGRKGEMIHFTVCNMNKQNNLYGHDMRPVVRCVPARPKWDRVRFSCTYSLADGDFSVRFKHRFEEDGQDTYFAFCYAQVRRRRCCACWASPVPDVRFMCTAWHAPQSYEECQAKLRELDAAHHWRPDAAGSAEARVAAAIAARSEDTAAGSAGARLDAALADPPEFRQPPSVCTGIYWFREHLTNSKDGRRMDLITVRCSWWQGWLAGWLCSPGALTPHPAHS